MDTRTHLVLGVAISASAALLAVLVARGVAQSQIPTEAPETTAPLIPSLDGATLFTTYCAVCHGKDADGRGPMASILKTQVPDLTRVSSRNGGVFPFARVERTIDGTNSFGLGHGTKQMPVWGPIFSQVTSDRDYGKVRVYNITKYLQTLQK